MASCAAYGSINKRKPAEVAERITLDTNILVYAFDESEPVKQPVAQDYLWRAHDAGAILTTTALGEFFFVMTRKAKVSPLKAGRIMGDLITIFPSCGYGVDALEAAALAVAGGRFSFWDAVLLSAAETAGCTICISEDMKDGTSFGNIKIRNLFDKSGGVSAAATAALAP